MAYVNFATTVGKHICVNSERQIKLISILANFLANFSLFAKANLTLTRRLKAFTPDVQSDAASINFE